MAQVGAPIRVHDDESRALSDAASADVDAPSTLSEAATPSSPLAVQRAADEVNSNDDGAAPSPGATDVGATPTGKRRAVRTESSKEATVTLKDGRQLTLYRRQEFPSRAAAKEFIHDFALAQGKRARLDPHMSGGRNFVYICNSKTKCDFIH
uniref:Uncharacterized protein n=1 Tax=Globisporangium ultimum (strain ATCC 200006 / CBS 805.95 / DAOM BR144) TaxID=431595 RepID=K3WAA2_GLOUD